MPLNFFRGACLDTRMICRGFVPNRTKDNKKLPLNKSETRLASVGFFSRAFCIAVIVGAAILAGDIRFTGERSRPNWFSQFASLPRFFPEDVYVGLFAAATPVIVGWSGGFSLFGSGKCPTNSRISVVSDQSKQLRTCSKWFLRRINKRTWK